MSFLINGTQVRIDDTHSVNDKVSAADSHIGSTSNPHSTTAAQVGAEPANANIQTHIGSTSNPHGVTTSQIGAEPANANIQTHISSTSNPHGVTAGQVGAEPANANIQTHISSTSNPHSVTATQVGLGNVTNESKATMFTSPTFTGTVALNGGQIKFPGTQVPSTDANTLDDYEEGTFTPAVTGTTSAGVGTYTVQTGKYTKIGNLVYFTSFLMWKTHTGTGYMNITGLPFTPSDNCPLSVSYLHGLSLLANNYLTGYTATGGWIQLQQFPVGGGNLADVSMDISAAIMIGGVYTT